MSEIEFIVNALVVAIGIIILKLSLGSSSDRQRAQLEQEISLTQQDIAHLQRMGRPAEKKERELLRLREQLRLMKRN